MKITLAIFAAFIAACSAEELKIEKIKEETCERKTKRGDMLSMHYKGTLEDGTEFDSSISRGEPFKFQIGVGQVIKGWDQGLLDMCVGDKRKLTVPAELGYGSRGAGDKIPGGATLIFETELLKIEDGPAQQNIFKQIDADSDQQLTKDEIHKYLEKQVPDLKKAGMKDIPDIEKMVSEIFDHEDQNKDGVISHDEFSGPKHDEL